MLKHTSDVNPRLYISVEFEFILNLSIECNFEMNSFRRGQPRNRELFELPTCNYLNSICYARTEGTPSDVRVSQT